MTIERLTNWVGIKKIADPQELVWQILSEKVRSDSCYVNYATKINEDVIFGRSKTPMVMRGRIVWEREEDGTWIKCKTDEYAERTVLCIPKTNLLQEINHIVETYKIYGFEFNANEWYRRGYIEKNGEGFMFKNTSDLWITRADSYKNREAYYRIILHDVGE